MCRDTPPSLVGYGYTSHPPLLIVAPPFASRRTPHFANLSHPRIAEPGDALDGHHGPGNSATSLMCVP